MPAARAKKNVGLDVPDGRLLTLLEVADVLGIKLRMARRLVESGRLQKTKVGRLVRVHPNDLADFVSKGRQ